MRRLVTLAGKGMVLMIALADVSINPKLDDSWMPDGLPGVVSSVLGTVLIVLAILFVVFCLVFAANKVFPSMRSSWSADGLYRIIGVVLVAILTVGVAPGIYWADHHVDPFPGGVNASSSSWDAAKPDSKLVRNYGVDGAKALINSGHDFRQVGRQFSEAGKKLSKGNVVGAIGSAASAGGSVVSGIREGAYAVIASVRHRGIAQTVSDGWKVLKNKAGQVGSSVAAWFKGRGRR